MMSLQSSLLSLLTTATTTASVSFMITTVIKRQLTIPLTKVKTQAQNLDHPSSLFNLSKKSNSSTPTYQRTPSSDGNAPAVTTSMAYLEKTALNVKRSESSQKTSMSTRLREEL